MAVTARARLGLLGVVLVAAVAVPLGKHVGQARLGTDAAAAARPGDIHMIASVTCTYCAEARAWFADHRVPFTECLIERDAACADAFRALGAPGTPVLLVRGRRIVGFDPNAVVAALH